VHAHQQVPARLANLIQRLGATDRIMTREGIRIPTPYTNWQPASMIVAKREAVSGAMGELLEDLGVLARAHHQDRAGSVADKRIGDASVDDPPCLVAASTPHDDQVRFQLLGQAHDLLVALNCTALRSRWCQSGVNIPLTLSSTSSSSESKSGKLSLMRLTGELLPTP
jgi:hypothetical protein